MKYLIYFSFILLASCTEKKTSSSFGTDSNTEQPPQSVEVSPDNTLTNRYYVPIYSDVYADQINQKVMLSANLSIRNMSDRDTVYISLVEYYNTDGNLVNSYLNEPIYVLPMATINFVVERDDDAGGHGANFIIESNTKQDQIPPLIQAVMVGYVGNKALSFITEGIKL